MKKISTLFFLCSIFSLNATALITTSNSGAVCINQNSVVKSITADSPTKSLIVSLDNGYVRCSDTHRKFCLSLYDQLGKPAFNIALCSNDFFMTINK